MFKKFSSAAVLLGTLTLVACGGGGGNSSTPDGLPVAKSECTNRFAGTGRVVGSGILEGSSNEAAANDGNLGSFASLYAGGTDTGTDALTVYITAVSQLNLRVTAASGVSFPAGTKAGAVAQLASGVTSEQLVTVTTYLGGVVQETFDGGSQVASTAAPMDQVFSYPTTKAYDAVQFTVQLSNPVSTERPQVKVYEFCG